VPRDLLLVIGHEIVEAPMAHGRAFSNIARMAR
jgi:hypothetical protein